VAADLGVDKLFAYPFEQATGHLNLYRATSISVKAGAGPRHLPFTLHCPLAMPSTN
jgi:6-phosphogluconolactonase (cycloisomerase 2 family)